MLNIFASAFMTATRQETTRREPQPVRPANPLRRVRASGLQLPTRKQN